MKQFRIKLSETIKRTQTITSFRFIPETKINFLPGQFAQMIFDRENPANRDLNKHLSFSCSPDKDYIEFTKRISQSSFSKKLSSLQAGDEAFIEGPWGKCVFKKEYKKIIFLVGGIGITPAISIIEYISQNNLDTGIKLFYSNRNEQDIAFRQALDAWSLVNKNLEIFYLVSECEPEDKNCILGRINKEILAARAIDVSESIFYAFGPPKMVEVMKGLCQDIKCLPGQLMTESFLGY